MKEQPLISLLAGKYQALFSHRLAGITILLLVITSRIIQQVFFFNTRSDMSFQVLGAEHLLHGHGISLAAVPPSDISQINYLPLNNWPPGFSLVFIPFYVLAGKNYILAGIALGIVAAVVLVFILRKIMQLLGAPVHLVNLFTLLTGFFGYYFYTFPCTDAVAVTSFAAAFYFALQLATCKQIHYFHLAAFILTLLLAGFIKYLYMPAMFIIPAFLVIQGYTSKQPVIKKAGLISFITLLLVTGSFLLTQQQATGTVGFIKEANRGFYLQNLQSVFPFATGAFIRPDTLMAITSKSDMVYKVLQGITIITALSLVVICLARFFRNRFRSMHAAAYFIEFSCWVSLAIIGLLAILSLRVGKETFDFGKWTYVQEARYYGLVIILLQLAAFTYYLQQTKNDTYKRVLFPALLLLLGIEAAKGIAFTGNRILHFGRETYGWQQELAFQRSADTIITNIARQHPGIPVRLTGTSDWMLLRISLYSHIPVIKTDGAVSSLNQLNASSNTILLLMIKEEEIPVYNSFISLNGTTDAGTAAGFHFYSRLVKP